MGKLNMLVASLGLCAGICALPTGFKSVAGKAVVKETENTMLIKAQNSSIVHWDNFSVTPQESIVFKLPSSKSAILNRVTSNSKSSLYGKIDSNGKVYLVNPHGIVIGPNANLTAAGVLLTTGHVCDDEFLKGESLTICNIGAEKGRIINLGKIESPNGDIYIISKRIMNNGSLIAPEGHVGMAMGDQVLIKPEGSERIFIKAGETRTASEHITAIDNHGTIQALITELKTSSNVYAQAIRHSGAIEATQTTQENGRVYLVSEGSRVTCNGSISAPGGDVKIDALRQVNVSGDVAIDVSHPSKPGTIAIGSEKSQSVSIDESVSIKADAKASGNGGKIFILSEGTNRFAGKISAEGNRGNGGYADISSKNQGLEYRGTVSLKGNGGKDGNLVLDPKYIVVQDSSDPYTDPATGQTFSSNPTESITISTADLSAALNSANVTLQANTDITMNDAVEATTSGNGLTLQAGRNITLNPESSITLNNGAFSATINDQNAIVADRESGFAQFRVYGSLSGEESISTQGGNISIQVGTFGGAQEGNIMLSQTVLDASGGNITIEGYGTMAAGEGRGITCYSPTTISTNGSGEINITGTGADNKSNNFGIYTSGSESVPTLISAENGNVNLTGNGGGSGVGSFNCGCYLSAVEVNTTGSGTVTVNGVGGAGTNLNCGLILSGNVTLVTSETGAVVVEGTASGTQEYNYGVRLESGAKITSTGTAPINVTGNGGASAQAGNCGVILTGRHTEILSPGGNITINGNGHGQAYLNQGVRIETNAAVVASNSAAINITGFGEGADNYDNGIFVSGIGSRITSVNGNIDLNGTGAGVGPTNQGVVLEYPSENVNSSGSGTLTINSNP